MSLRARDPALRPGPALVVLLVLAVLVVALAGPQILAVAGGGEEGRLGTFSTVFLSVVLQALPFLALGVALAGAVTAFVPDRVLHRALPRRALFGVPVATASGALVPGCECGSVPFAGRLMGRGVAPSSALAFMLASPAINPVVVVATAVAFPGRPMMVVARVVASSALAIVVGWVWSRVGVPAAASADQHVEHPGRRAAVLAEVVTADLLASAGFLVLGAACVALLQVTVPPTWSAAVAGVPVLSVVVLGLLAVLVAVCSEADAFVAAGLAGFSATAQLAFMVVGPALDVKLAALHVGIFGARFAARLAALVLAVALAVSLLVGAVLL
ncbi:hypothetical protein EV188_101131 [Actinomycetospora succinea]|uniref:Permease n=1 Tax=Actinomycetospora succinea TaxID=663603 RepID=A0A4R6VLV1_9PSEU|nr:permease [Actinomycetospora succinea]TDQ64883.1 hypothetical protein EV188_101131 [Actinomycetospora succinea]